MTPPTTSIDWDNLGFEYRDLNDYAKFIWTEEKGWSKPTFEKEPYVKVHICATGLNYGQQCFEGLKAFRDPQGLVRVFRPEVNAARMIRSADMVYAPAVPIELFEESIRLTVTKNLEFVPPGSSGGSLYLRPLLFGSGPFIGMGPAKEFTFIVFGMPVGNYYKGNAVPVDCWVIEDFDRTAPFGTGACKIGGNYAPTFKPMKAAKDNGFPIILHLDPKSHTMIDEFSTSNFIALTYPDPRTGKQTLVTPDSSTVLRSVTRLSLCDLAKKLGYDVEERPILFSELEQNKFVEVAACGTSAVVTPIKKIVRGDRTEIGKGFLKLFNEYRGIQKGEIKDTFGWMWPAEGF
ncbi:hypothetical protein PHYBLDRAFT_155775 [Phycomyces blakesleeanus NRRL 1555(-)]|uniref:Branched-chain amino acid aminotransferase n=1 Tax=Phycomyces blakesleeanus (strain ATCC 8743b / DSM 1359 / FGSC 10004 / NBRC 33097 / NRRL 1555) TaxID=763407 RepID=A0A163DJZ0_PHYB8|nr:hypothetical protein PHYBLDRAFT_155775 [Phycomyces blakesleeanus NRRL 1555(-)]OAD71800.1 hypothetical protein PHYBLDRAFT_155775 [Phycomyces blakesleeanus NRRL 1555(-)]|eukprot:XP_018289840.1 hypothetical protein PHYBLDRAFT_155775 [Phycomyces blakesleeanus NRRL 1555(-)]